MDTIVYVILFSALGGVASLAGGLILLSKQKTAKALAKYATPFAGGALLSAVFLDLLKEGIEISSGEKVLLSALIGLVIFFLAESFLSWFHHHHEHADTKDPTTSLIIFGDTAHNALDGVAIGAAFLVSIPTGIVTSVAVAAHEIPQEIGDFGLLLSKGMRRKKVILFNFLSAIFTVVFAVITYSVGSENNLPLGVLLGLSAGFLLYIATSDIIPSIHENRGKKHLYDVQTSLFLLGLLSVGLITTFAHQYIDAGHDNDSHEVSEQHKAEDDHQDE